MSEVLFPVVPICEKQRRDVKDFDLLMGGLYRKCNTYKAGGGYDKFPEIYRKRTGMDAPNIENQFVVQLAGCPLDCDYCYVTREGVWGATVLISAEQLVEHFYKSGCGTFHLMGGAPALYLDKWTAILKLLDKTTPFHSDFVLCEGIYDENILNELYRHRNGIYAVSIKGSRSFYEAMNVNFGMVAENMALIRNLGTKYYCTFTGMSKKAVTAWKRRFPLNNWKDSFKIDIVEYEALKGRVYEPK